MMKMKCTYAFILLLTTTITVIAQQTDSISVEEKSRQN